MRTSRVLLVEDNPIMCRFVCSALEAEDIRVTEAHAGAEALGLWAAEASDLVLQDVILPDMDGFELVARLRGLPGGAAVPILALSGLLSESDEARVSAVGFNDIILKPLEASQLRQVVRAHLPQKDMASSQFGQGRRILIVDDDPIQSKLVGFRLARLGFEISTASDGMEALDRARLRAPDAIVSDIMMPRLDGFGLCSAIRQDAALAGIPVVLMTNSYVDEADRQLARAAGADEFVIRTPTMLEVVEAVQNSLSRRATDRQFPPARTLEMRKVWTRRLMSQLDRQVSINAGMARRCSMLSAELAVLSGISDALASDHDIRSVLTNVLGACVDAGGFSLGVLHVAQKLPGALLWFGDWDGVSELEIQTVLDRVERTPEITRGEPLLVAAPDALRALSPLLEQKRVTSVIVIPVRRLGVPFGTLLMGSNTQALHHEDRLAFLEGVATQIAQAVTLTQAFAEKEVSEQRATKQAAVLQSVVETVAEGVIVTDARGEFLLWNPSAEAILGKGSAQVPIREWPERLGLCSGDTFTPVAPDQVPLWRALMGQVVDERELFSLSETATTPRKYITMSARPLREQDGAAGAVAVLRDVTEERATQSRLMVADRLASIGMLAAGVAHEINNPLTAVVGNLQLAAESFAAFSELHRNSPELKEHARMLQEATEAAGRVRGIVQDLRVLARREADESGPVDVHAVLESVLRVANNEVRHRARIVRAYGDVPLVAGNESRLSQVFLNLVINAAQALPDGRADQNEIRLSTKTDERGRVVVTVADTGEGISPESMRQLFVPFFTTKRAGIGTGLGLSICQRLVNAAGGEISVESSPGRGSAFHVALLPAVGRKLETAPQPSTASVRPALRRGRILMVDDETLILNILHRALARNHDCTGVTTAREALTRVQAGERFDLILCDLMMPVMNGMDLYVELERLAPDQARKVIFLTGGAFTPALQHFLRNVENKRLEKPFDLDELQATVKARLNDVTPLPRADA